MIYFKKKLKQSHIYRQVLDRYGFIDRERVGIWGHSYGGYATLLTLLHDEENLFQCGVSGAPVTSWLYYSKFYNIKKYNRTIFFSMIIL